jgi:FkbM family methyltransferase
MGAGEEFERDLLVESLAPGGVMVDVGANVGYYSILAAQKVGPSGRVFAFEPDPDNFRTLRRVARSFGYKHLALENKAVVDTPGNLRLFLSAASGGDHRVYDPGDGRTSVPVAATSLDIYFASGGSQVVDVVKMDIQGAEVAALNGMRGLLAANPGLRLFVEFWPRGLAEARSSARAFLDLIGELGLEFVEINEVHHALQPTSVRALVEMYTVENGRYTNLLCSRRRVLTTKV